MATKKIKKIPEIEKNSPEYESMFINENNERLDAFLRGDGAEFVRRLLLESDVCRPLGEEKEITILEQKYNDWVKKIDDFWILEGLYNKKTTIKNIKKHIISLQMKIKELELNTQIDLETKKKKIDRYYTIIKNCKWTLEREFAHMQCGR